ncbi:transposase zinc-binding domain-containing protein [Sorangium sp. So ce119]|uniref:transposase zinc-binding domain-containing protein n=1 Tax=Sorangium sp. So ce119 TaxID=3133279 RepID=UPI003F601749
MDARSVPECQSLSQARWIAERQQRILPTHHVHVVFALPASPPCRPAAELPASSCSRSPFMTSFVACSVAAAPVRGPTSGITPTTRPGWGNPTSS